MIFPGNTNDCETLLPIWTEKKDYEVGRIIVVADKGVNTADNIAFNLPKATAISMRKVCAAE